MVRAKKMKRAFAETESPRRSAWQQPASCQFCRLKKIRCDKKRPCYNCTSRDLVCEYVSSQSGTRSSQATQGSIEDSDRLVSLERHVLDIRDRLTSLEILLQNRPCQCAKDDMQLLPPDHGDKYPPSKIAKGWEDHLEEVAATPDLDFQTQVSRLYRAWGKDVVGDQRYASNTNASIRNLAAKLPNLHSARILFEHYVQSADSLHRELHVPSARALLETMYAQPVGSFQVSPEVLSLFFSIFASSIFYRCQCHCSEVPEELECNPDWCSVWKESAMELILKRTSIESSSLTSLQSACIMLYLVWDLEGPSTSFYMLKSVAYAKAIQMKIHKLDADYIAVKGDSIEVETKRRLWWHLAATDWLLASVPGAVEGIYNIHPQHMCVKYPANVDDEDIRPGVMGTKEKPEDQPTSMSFLLQRIRFAQLCREVVDSLQSSSLSTPPLNYGMIHQLSEKLLAFKARLPWFFNTDEKDSTRRAALAVERPYIPLQRQVLLYGVFSRILRLHRPFLAQSLWDPQYSFSREVGVDCAEELLKIGGIVQREDICQAHSHSKDQHLFGALLFLSVDIMTGPEDSRTNSRTQNLTVACKVLKERQRTLHPSGNGLTRAIERLSNVLKQPMRRHVSFNSSNIDLGASLDETVLTTSTTAGTEATREESVNNGGMESPLPLLLDDLPHLPDGIQGLMFDDISDMWGDLFSSFPSNDIFDCLENQQD